MFVRGEPISVSLRKSDRDAHPVIIRLAVRTRATNMIETVRKSRVVSAGDHEVARFNPDWTIKRLKPLSKVLARCFLTAILKRRREIELQNVVGVM